VIFRRKKCTKNQPQCSVMEDVYTFGDEDLCIDRHVLQTWRFLSAKKCLPNQSKSAQDDRKKVFVAGLPDVGIFPYQKSQCRFLGRYIFEGLECKVVVNFTVIWNMLRPFGKFVVVWYNFSTFWYILSRDIWQSWQEVQPVSPKRASKVSTRQSLSANANNLWDRNFRHLFVYDQKNRNFAKKDPLGTWDNVLTTLFFTTYNFCRPLFLTLFMLYVGGEENVFFTCLKTFSKLCRYLNLDLNSLAFKNMILRLRLAGEWTKKYFIFFLLQPQLNSGRFYITKEYPDVQSEIWLMPLILA
jgi:hypothetical protein